MSPVPTPGARPCPHSGRKLLYHACPAPGESAAGVHALVIGISQYDRRRRGGAQVMANLPGAATAAARFARFVADELRDPTGVPVRTVRLLTSLMPDQTVPDSDEASLEQVQFALDDWAEDCDRHPGNVAVLYIAGHGVATALDARWAFLSPAGATESPYTFALNLTAIKASLAFCRARSNVFVWDVCALRGEEIPAYRTGNVGLTAPDLGERNRPGAVDQVTIMARMGTRAYSGYGREHTILSRALIGLDAAEARNRLLHTAGELLTDGQYAVTARRLGELLLPAMRRLNPAMTDGEEPVVDPRDSAAGINRPEPPPEFAVELRWQPGPGEPPLGVTIAGPNGGDPISRTIGAGFSLGLAAGEYRVTAVRRTSDGTERSSFDLRVDRDRRINALDGADVP
ncbi:hypothetical protein ACQP00_22280 [Dactylosporangium sp. CS-047395]|uniref:hypothetical protein n=1 Tax=Dactylosporangium sp. CS-047395 TaxID=3239936 RepID=UPI003D9310AA